VKELLKRLEPLQPILGEESRIVAAYLFGSQADGYAMPWSDVDLAILWAEIVTPATELALDAEISLALGTDKVDVVNLAKVSLALQYRVIATGTLLYERNAIQLAEFVQRTLVRYFDFLPVLQTYEREFMRSLEHDYGT
jgi:predicted nucleotidyltransferase